MSRSGCISAAILAGLALYVIFRFWQIVVDPVFPDADATPTPTAIIVILETVAPLPATPSATPTTAVEPILTPAASSTATETPSPMPTSTRVPQTPVQKG